MVSRLISPRKESTDEQRASSLTKVSQMSSVQTATASCGEVSAVVNVCDVYALTALPPKSIAAGSLAHTQVLEA